MRFDPKTRAGTAASGWLNPPGVGVTNAYLEQMRAINWGVWLRLESNTADSSANGRTDITGGGSVGQTGLTSGFLSEPDGAWMDSTTFSALVSFTTSTTDKSIAGRFSETVNTDKCWVIDAAGGGGKVRAIATNTSNVNAVVTSTVGYCDSYRHLAVITYNSSNLLTLYVDGASVGTPATLAGTENNASAAVGLWIGKRSAIDTGVFAYGSISEFAYAPGVVLNSTQVSDINAAYIANY